MSRFFPHTPYAEDQPLAHAILATHVLYRGFQSGAFTGLVYSSATSLLKTSSSTSTLRIPLRSAGLLGGATARSAGYGALAGFAIMIPGLIGRMWGREEIEWQDRSWRLLENEGQKEVDDWSLVGTLLGGVAAAQQVSVESGTMAKTARLSGGAGIGSLLGVAGYLGWRYGVRGGKRADGGRV